MTEAQAYEAEKVFQNAGQGRTADRWFDAALAMILLAGALVRVLLWIYFQNLPLGIWDENEYNLLAKNVVEHGEYTFTPGTLTTLRPPLYPAMVAGVYSVFGVENYQAVRLLQAGLSLLNVVILYALGKEIGSRRLALWLAGLYCFYPSFLGFGNLLLTETLFTLLACTFCYLVIVAIRRESLGYLLFAGVTLGLATLTRSIFWMFPPVLAVFLLAVWNASWPRRLLAVLSVTVAFALTLAPWAVRNSLLEETFVPVDTMGGRNFMMGNYEHTPFYRSWDAISLTGEVAWYSVLFKEIPSTEGLTQGKIDKLALSHGLRFVWANPGLTALRDLIKFFDFWGVERTIVAGAGRGYFGPLPHIAVIVLAVVIMGSYVIALFLGIFGLFLAPLGDARAQAFLLLMIAYICGIHTLVFAHPRYHLPIMPLVLVFTASAITARPFVWQRWRQRGFWLASGICAFLVAGWIWGLVAGDLDKFRDAVFALV
jgi:4-amino-4-deoxy-L-arabinose transferase-like glycosyltransferase